MNNYENVTLLSSSAPIALTNAGSSVVACLCVVFGVVLVWLWCVWGSSCLLSEIDRCPSLSLLYCFFLFGTTVCRCRAEARSLGARLFAISRSVLLYCTVVVCVRHVRSVRMLKY